MIIYHQNNVGAFAGNHIWYWPTQPLVQLHHRIAVAAGVAGDELIAQSRALQRFVVSRVFGRVN